MSCSQKSKPPQFQVEKPRPGHFGTKAVSKSQLASKRFRHRYAAIISGGGGGKTFFEKYKTS